MKVQFRHNGDWWFDPETEEFEYEGGNGLINQTLEQMSEYEDTEPVSYGLVTDDHPNERWTDLSPEDKKAKVLNILSRIDGVEINE